LIKGNDIEKGKEEKIGRRLEKDWKKIEVTCNKIEIYKPNPRIRI
jgi:hypothetical protein